MATDPHHPLSPLTHFLAVALVVVTFPLLWVGGLVTTYKAGMAVPDWPNTYGYNLFLYPWQTWVLGPWDVFIEHGHRLLGATVGFLTIALVIAVWLRDGRRWIRVLSLVALASVILQGSLGGLRVLLDQVQIAKIHGCFGPAFFALTVAMATFTSRSWRSASLPNVDASAYRVQRLAMLTTVLAYAQLVLGAQLRHVSAGAGPDDFRTALVFHLAVAGALLIHVLLLTATVLRSYRGYRELSAPATGLALLLFVQLALGAGTWIAKYGTPAWLADYWGADFVVAAESASQAIITTAHVATGSLILVTSLLLTLRSFRLFKGVSGMAALGNLPMGVAA